jgi:hypothetical protein
VGLPVVPSADGLTIPSPAGVAQAVLHEGSQAPLALMPENPSALTAVADSHSEIWTALTKCYG